MGLYAKNGAGRAGGLVSALPSVGRRHASHLLGQYQRAAAAARLDARIAPTPSKALKGERFDFLDRAPYNFFCIVVSCNIAQKEILE